MMSCTVLIIEDDCIQCEMLATQMPQQGLTIRVEKRTRLRALRKLFKPPSGGRKPPARRLETASKRSSYLLSPPSRLPRASWTTRPRLASKAARA
jgi:hypothetical protein